MTGFADDIGGTLARLIGYLCTLALIAMLGAYLWDQLPDPERESAPKTGWSLATRSVPAFAASQFDLSYKTDAYQVLRQPEGRRKDVLRWTDLDGGDPGGELNERSRRSPTLRGGWTLLQRAFEAAGVIGSIFGAVTLLRFNGEADGARSCINFLERTDQRPSCWFSCNF